MTELLTAAQMRQIEQDAIKSGSVTGLELMERAGRGVVEAVFEEWPELAATSHRAVVLCGPGNNGGDGFVVARLLKEWGWEVEVFLYGEADKLPPDAKANYERWGGAKAFNSQDVLASWSGQSVALVIDALFGTGLTRPLDIERSVKDDLNHYSGSSDGPRVVSIDLPSGLCADSGRYLGSPPARDHGDHVHISSSMTVTFHSRKVGHFCADGPGNCGILRVVDIGLGPNGNGIGTPQVILIETEAHNGPIEGISKAAYRHKYAHGHALILSGGPGKTGAARLAARGALRIGAGLVTLGVPPAAQMEVASLITAIMLKRVTAGDDGKHGLDLTLADGRINALCLGPGLGVDARGRALVASALEANRATVLDADALALLAQDKALFNALHAGCVLTPHGGEFARLFPDIAEKLNALPTIGPAYSKVDATREAAKRAGCVVLFKGPDTVIAHPDGQCTINSAQYDREAPWLATAGSGDVLAGFITGLLARGFEPMQAAETAAWLHVECARSFGPGLIAEDLPEELPKVFRKLGL